MNKPLAVAIKETRMKLVDACNESGLPLVVLDLIMQGVYLEIHSFAERQIDEEEKSYIELLKEENNKNNVELEK